MPRNPVLISNLDEENHQWLLWEAKRQTVIRGVRVTMTDLINEYIQQAKVLCLDEQALDQARKEGVLWLKETVNV